MKVPSTTIQNDFGKYLQFVEANEEVIITRSGKNTAKMIPCHDADSVSENPLKYQSSDNWVTYEAFRELTHESEQRFELIDGVL